MTSLPRPRPPGHGTATDSKPYSRLTAGHVGSDTQPLKISMIILYSMDTSAYGATFKDNVFRSLLLFDW